VAGSTENSGSTTETVKIPISSLTWGAVGAGCTKTTDTIANGSIEIHANGDTHNGSFTLHSAEWTTNTIFGSCVYGSGATLNLGTIKGGNPATLEVNTLLPKTGGNAACPAETRWTAAYKVTSPSPLWIATGNE
jgi:hypothetical protein